MISSGYKYKSVFGNWFGRWSQKCSSLGDPHIHPANEKVVPHVTTSEPQNKKLYLQSPAWNYPNEPYLNPSFSMCSQQLWHYRIPDHVLFVPGTTECVVNP